MPAMDAEKVIPVQSKTMIEKWLLVLLIVGGTSLVFLICFPIDFYLYRRRKRLARERSSAVDKKPIQVYRAGQYHAQVYPDSVDSATEIDEGLKGDLRENDIKPSRFVRIVNLFRKKKTESRLMQLQKLTEKSESSSSENPCVYITSENREETSIFRSHDTQITIPGSADQSNVLTPESSHQDGITTSYQGLNESEFSVHENSTNENIPYMAKALSVIMNENEELFTPENKHLNYGSTEKISTVHVTREMIESIKNSLFVDDTAQSTSKGKQGLDLLGTFDTDTQSQTGTVFFTDTGESSTDNADKVVGNKNARDKNVINVKSNGDADILNIKPPKSHSKRSKSSKNGVKIKETNNAENQIPDIQPSPLPKGIVHYNLSESEETASDESEDLNDKHSVLSSNNGENHSIGGDRNSSPFFKNMTSSFSDQYLSKERRISTNLAIKQPIDIDEFADNRPSIDLTNSNFSLLEEAAISSRRKKKKKRSDDRLSPNSLPNLPANKSRIKSKQDYYKERRTVSATGNKFSKY